MGSIRRAFVFLVAASTSALAACGVLLGTDEDASSGSSSGAPNDDGAANDDSSSANGGSNPDGGAGDAEAGPPVGLSCGSVTPAGMAPPVCSTGEQCCRFDAGVEKCIMPADPCTGLRLMCDLSFGCDVGIGCSLTYGAFDGLPKGTICGQSPSPSLTSYWMCGDAAPCPDASSICRAGSGFPSGFSGCDAPVSNN